MTRSATIGKEAAVRCSHCGVDVTYYIDNSVLPIQDDLTELIQYRDESVDSSHAVTRSAGRRRPTRKSLPRNKC